MSLKSSTVPFFMLLVLLISTVPASADFEWRIIGPGCGSDLLTGAIQPDDPDIMYIAGDIEGIFRTTDGGESWTMINYGLCGGDRPSSVYGIQEIVIDPVDYNTLYVCTWSGLFKSTNKGDYWDLLYPIPLDEEGPMVSYLAIDPDDTDILYMGIGDADFNADGTGSLYRSSDGGAEWELLDVGMGDETVVHSILVDPTSAEDNRRLFVSTDNGVFRSTDNGENWSSINTGLPHRNSRRLIARVSDNNLILFLGIETEGDPDDPDSWAGGLYKSANGGDNWVSINGNLPAWDEDSEAHNNYYKYDVHPTDPDIIYIGTKFSDAYIHMGTYKTTNGGDSWIKADDGDTDNGNVTYGWLDEIWWDDLYVAVLKISPSNPDIVLVGKDYPRISRNAGNSWEQIYTDEIDGHWRGRGMELMIVYDFAFDATDSDLMYVAYDDMGLFRSDDGGVTFARLDPVQDPDEYDAAHSVVLDPVNGDVYLGRNNGVSDSDIGYTIGTVLKSTNLGVDFEYIRNGLPEGRPVLVLDPESSVDSRVLYCTVYGEGVYKTTNGGQSWSAVNTGLGSDAAYAWEIAINPVDTQVLYVALNTLEGNGDGGVYRTTNGGGSWSKLDQLPELDVLTVEIDPSNPDKIYVGGTVNYDWVESGGLYKSENGGDSWTLIFEQPRIKAVVIHPEDSDVIFAASQSFWNYIPGENYGMYRSSDGGESWELINFNLAHTYIMTAKINPLNPDQIFIGTHGGGVWTSDNNLASVETENEVPFKYELIQSYPNPFNSSTRIIINNPARQMVHVQLFTIEGRLVADLLNTQLPAGISNRTLQAESLSAGLYFITVQAGDDFAARKIVKLD